MTIKPVFDGGSKVMVRDGILMREGGRWVIRKHTTGWPLVREATDAEIAAAYTLRLSFRQDHLARTVKITPES